MTRRNDPYRQQVFRSLALVGYLGFGMAVPVAAGAWLGHLADRSMGATGLLTVLGILMGVAAGGMSAYKIIMQALSEGTSGTSAQRDDGRDTRDDNGPGTP